MVHCVTSLALAYHQQMWALALSYHPPVQFTTNMKRSAKQPTLPVPNPYHRPETPHFLITIMMIQLSMRVSLRNQLQSTRIPARSKLIAKQLERPRTSRSQYKPLKNNSGVLGISCTCSSYME